MGGPGSRTGSAAAVALLFVLAGCAAVPPRVSAPRPAPPEKPPGPPVAALPVPRPGPFVPAPSRPVRVLLEERGGELALEADIVRGWDASGRLLAEERGRVTASAVGGKIRWGRNRLLDSPLDVSGAPALRFGKGELPGRLRIAARKGALLLVAVVPLEEYVAGVVSREAAPSFPGEALKSIAVAARTYALGALEKPRDPAYDVVGGVDDQVFEAAGAVPEPFREAAEETRGEVLVYGGALARAVYHSTCGGATESAAAAWGKDYPYLRSVPCDDCRESPAWRWEYRMGLPEGRRIARALGIPAGGALRIEIAARTATGRASRVRLSSGGVTREAPGAVFRREAGYARVRSLKFEVRPLPDGWLFLGAGYGHGVGMCQWGANGMAKRGKGYREILARYYPGTAVSGDRF